MEFLQDTYECVWWTLQTLRTLQTLPALQTFTNHLNVLLVGIPSSVSQTFYKSDKSYELYKPYKFYKYYKPLQTLQTFYKPFARRYTIRFLQTFCPKVYHPLIYKHFTNLTNFTNRTVFGSLTNFYKPCFTNLLLFVSFV